MHVIELNKGNQLPTASADAINKARSREGLVPVRKTISRNGKAYEATYWVRPKDLRNMQTENAAKFLEGMVKAQRYFQDAADRAKEVLPEAAAAMSEKLKAMGSKVKKIGDLELELAEYSRKNPNSADDILAAIHSRPESEIPQKVKDLVNKLYQDISTTTFGEQLKIGGSVQETSVRTSAAEKMTQWKPGEWTKKLGDIVGKKVSQIKGLLGMRKIANENPNATVDKKTLRAAAPKLVPKAAAAKKKPIGKVSPEEQSYREGKLKLTVKQPVSAKESRVSQPIAGKATSKTPGSLKGLRERLKKEGFHAGIEKEFVKLTGKVLPKGRVERLHVIEQALGVKKRKNRKIEKGGIGSGKYIHKRKLLSENEVYNLAEKAEIARRKGDFSKMLSLLKDTKGKVRIGENTITTYWDTSTKNYRTLVLNKKGDQIDDADYTGHKESAATAHIWAIIEQYKNKTKESSNEASK